MPRTVEVSIIIPTLNEQAYVGRAVARARAMGPKEVIVVDGGSCDATAARARARGARVITGARGRACQQNLGAHKAAGQVLLFLHADTWLPADALRQIENVMDKSHVLGGAFYQKIDHSGPAYRLLERGNAARVRWFGLPYGDQGIFMRADIFRSLGGFPNAAIMEDLLLMQRFRRLGRPALLPGPLHVSPRRWCRHGIVRQTLKNWALLAAHRLGARTEWLAGFYLPHGSKPAGSRNELKRAESTKQGNDAEQGAPVHVCHGTPWVHVPADGKIARDVSD